MVYEGERDYIFVSYPHKDAHKVLPYLNVLGEQGFRVWYDAGIEAGTEWPEYIEEHLSRARVVLVFMTPNTVESKNCRNEINFALELDKEVLVVYLEETSLVKGMRLQLNSTQSLFRNKHSSDGSFVHELVNARILQCCRDGYSGAPATPVRAPQPRVSSTRVSNVCSMGTNDENDVWPTNGTYSQVINRDRFRVIVFHMQLTRTFGFYGNVNTRYQVYNSDDNLIFEEEGTLSVQPNFDRIGKCWILRGMDGTFVPSGEYRFVCSINDSPDFTYYFTVTSKGDRRPSFIERVKDILGF